MQILMYAEYERNKKNSIPYFAFRCIIVVFRKFFGKKDPSRNFKAWRQSEDGSVNTIVVISKRGNFYCLL